MTTPFDEGYYHRAERGGFKSYDYASAEMQQQLGYKWHEVQERGPRISTILFVGCALGFEVAFFRKRGIRAFGVDVSTYAIENAHPDSRPWVRQFDGSTLSELDDHYETAASFDVFAIVKDREKLAAEMCRVASRRIILRVTILPWRTDGSLEAHGMDGAPFKLFPFEYYDRIFTASGKFRLANAIVNCTSLERYEAIYQFDTNWL